jgi:uncharacterized protein YcbK (DUF882 family)
MGSFVKIVRVVLMAGAMLSLIALSGTRVQAGDGSSERGQDHALRLYNTHTGERLEVVFRRGEQYIPGALAKLDYFLRDHNTGDVRHFDPRLYDILADLTASVGHPDGEIDIVCGYRTPSTNESLRAHTTGVAKNSLHIQAEAIDLRMPGVNTRLSRQPDHRQLTRVRVTLIEDLLERSVVPVDIVVKVNGSILHNDHRAIDNQDRDRMREIYLLRRGSIHCRAHAFQVPVSRSIAQRPHGKIGGPFQANAAVAEIAPGLGEEFLLGRIVHIDVVAIRKNKFHQAE